MTLMDFLLAHPVDHLEKEVIVSQRLRDYPFLVRGVTVGEMDQYQRRCRKNREFDSGAFQMLLVVNHCISPDFRNVDTLEKSGCSTPEALVERVLKAGEVSDLAQSICDLSGFGQNLRTLANEVKN